jgi:hydroxymethylbilane synthase
MKSSIKIATRKSLLAIKQTEIVKDKLLAIDPDLEIEFVELSTEGDDKLDQSLVKIGGKGLFIKNLENALLDKKADFAVHSMKDMPYEMPKGLIIASILKREDPRDVLVAKVDALSKLAYGAVIGTSSLRRRSQLLRARPDLKVEFIRGNVITRLKKYDDGEFDAIVLAAAGLKRLGLEDRISFYFSIDEMIPAVGQGAIGLECREGDDEMIDLLKKINDQLTHDCIMAERKVSESLAASCHTPLGAYADINADVMTLRAMVSNTDGDKYIHSKESSGIDHFIKLGEEVAKDLISKGAKGILEHE